MRRFDQIGRFPGRRRIARGVDNDALPRSLFPGLTQRAEQAEHFGEFPVVLFPARFEQELHHVVIEARQFFRKRAVPGIEIQRAVKLDNNGLRPRDGAHSPAAVLPGQFLPGFAHRVNRMLVREGNQLQWAGRKNLLFDIRTETFEHKNSSTRCGGIRGSFKLFFVFAFFAAQMMNGQTSSVEAQTSAGDRQRQQTIDAMTKSVSTQMNAIRASRKIAVREPSPEAFFVLDPELKPASSSSPACDPMSAMAAQSLASKAAAANQISPELVFAVMRQESAFVPCAVSDKGALGLMQLMPDTATQLGVFDPLDAEQNVLGGAKYLKQLFTRYSGDLNKTLGAYNAGPGRVDDYDGVPPFPETLNYVDSIMNSLQPAKH